MRSKSRRERWVLDAQAAKELMKNVVIRKNKLSFWSAISYSILTKRLKDREGNSRVEQISDPKSEVNNVKPSLCSLPKSENT